MKEVFFVNEPSQEGLDVGMLAAHHGVKSVVQPSMPFVVLPRPRSDLPYCDHSEGGNLGGRYLPATLRPTYTPAVAMVLTKIKPILLSDECYMGN